MNIREDKGYTYSPAQRFKSAAAVRLFLDFRRSAQ